MGGVKRAVVTWAFGGAGEGLQGLGNAPYPLPLILGSCTIAADAFATFASGSGVSKGRNSGD
jgi:hypothetical protein